MKQRHVKFEREVDGVPCTMRWGIIYLCQVLEVDTGRMAQSQYMILVTGVRLGAKATDSLHRQNSEQVVWRLEHVSFEWRGAWMTRANKILCRFTRS